ncbi:hypothetical protein CLOSTMETH_00623 [[Clostridium] methylpentosum DSM 5476]|uniref:Uncharacterized protein n=1 Tax=[Clostridium] methylpentosum DSM 5476 TaxID=537013 RepID=C0E9X1_9FIRM|nr:hypothetical protein CLOSTMETH_00623 [[Clostridium] methylpentosum DSM 5476]
MYPLFLKIYPVNRMCKMLASICLNAKKGRFARSTKQPHPCSSSFGSLRHRQNCQLY